MRLSFFPLTLPPSIGHPPPVPLSPSTLAILVLLGFIAFSNSLTNDFVFDDTLIVENNPLVNAKKGIFEIFRNDYWHNQFRSGDYRPITILSYYFNHTIGCRSALGFRLTNIVIHIANTVLLILLLFSIFQNRYTAIFAGLIFLLHPVHQEAVIGIVGRAELLAFFFSICSLHIYRRPIRGGTIVSALFYLLAILSKESAVITPVFFLACDIFENGRWRWRLAFMVIPLILVLLARQYFLGYLRPLEEHAYFHDTSVAVRMMTMMKNFLYYLRLLFLPLFLCPDYSYQAISNVATPYEPLFLFGLTLLLLLSTSILLLRSRIPKISVMLGLFLLSFLPIANIVPMGTNLAERLLYTPSALFSTMIAMCLLHLPRRQILYLLLLLLPLTFQVLRYNSIWKNSTSLFSHAASIAPRSARIQTNLAIAYAQEGRFQEALEHGQEALKLGSPTPAFFISMGAMLIDQGRFQEAESILHQGIERKPSPEIHYNLAMLYYRQQRYLLSKREVRKALDILSAQSVSDNKGLARCHVLDGLIHLNAKDLVRARASFYLAVTSDPYNVTAILNQGSIAYVEGKTEDAYLRFREAIYLGGRGSTLYNNIGIAALGLARLSEAKQWFEKAISIDKNDITALGNLGDIALTEGFPDLAQRYYRRVLSIDRDNQSAAEKYRSLVEREDGPKKPTDEDTQ